MTSNDKGEWKLVKVWECKKCKLLIRDGRDVFGHECDVEGKEDKLLTLRKTIEDQYQDISELKSKIEDRDRYIDSQKNRLEGLNNFIKELNRTIDARNGTIDDRNEIIEDKNKIIDTKDETIDEQKKIIADKETIIENQKKYQKKVVEKIIYIEKNGQKTGGDKRVENINVDIWTKDYNIKDSKDSGYREEIEIEIFERGKGKEKIIIKNGKVIKKPDDIVIIGENTPEGFITKGIYRN